MELIFAFDHRMGITKSTLLLSLLLGFCLFFLLFYITVTFPFRQGHLKHRLSLTSGTLYVSEWPWIPPPRAFISRVLGLQTCSSPSGFGCSFFKFRFLLAFSYVLNQLLIHQTQSVKEWEFLPMFSLLVILCLKIFFYMAGGSTRRRRMGTWDQTKNMCPFLVYFPG